MAERLRSIDPLRHEVPIVDAAGRPTPQFMRQWMQTRSVDEAVGVASDSLTGLLDDFAAHGPRHHAGGDMALDLDSIAGQLDASRLYGSALLDTTTAIGAVNANRLAVYDDPEFPAHAAFAVEAGGGGLFYMGSGASSTDIAAGRIEAGVFGAALGILRADELGAGGQDSAFHLSRTNHTGTQDATTLTGTLADARLSSNVPLKNTTSTYTASQIFQRTASNLLAIRFSTTAGAFTEIMVDGSYAMGVGGSPRDLRHRRTAAGILEIDNNAGGAAELDVTGYGLFGGSAVNAQAVLEARSTARGFLPPRMTTTQRDAISATPVAGLTVYNTTTSKVQTWDGAAWQDHW